MAICLVDSPRATSIGAALAADWIEHLELRSDAEMEAFADFSELLVVGTKNLGEAGVLALARWSIRDGLLTVPLVAELADDLLASKYHLPFRPGGFKLWAEENGLV